MQEIVKVIIGVFVLVLGFPIGKYLAKSTKEELKSGKKWFKAIIILSSVLAFVGLIIKNDFLLFGFSFVAIVASRSI